MLVWRGDDFGSTELKNDYCKSNSYLTVGDDNDMYILCT